MFGRIVIFAGAAILVSLVPACVSEDPQPTRGGEQEAAASPSEAELSPTEDTSACLGEKKGRIIELSAGDPKDKSQFGDYRFAPTKIAVPAGEYVTFKVKNPTAYGHTFTVESLGCDSGYFASGETVFVSLKFPKGTIPFRCLPHSQVSGDDISGMAGEIVAR